MTQEELIRFQYLGTLGLLAEVSVYITNGADGDELRDLIEQAMEDAKKLGLVKWRRILNRIEVEPA